MMIWDRHLLQLKFDLEIIKQNASDKTVKGKLEDAKILVGSTIRTVSEDYLAT